MKMFEITEKLYNAGKQAGLKCQRNSNVSGGSSGICRGCGMSSAATAARRGLDQPQKGAAFKSESLRMVSCVWVMGAATKAV